MDVDQDTINTISEIYTALINQTPPDNEVVKYVDFLQHKEMTLLSIISSIFNDKKDVIARLNALCVKYLKSIHSFGRYKYENSLKNGTMKLSYVFDELLSMKTVHKNVSCLLVTLTDRLCGIADTNACKYNRAVASKFGWRCVQHVCADDDKNIVRHKMIQYKIRDNPDIKYIIYMEPKTGILKIHILNVLMELLDNSSYDEISITNNETRLITIVKTAKYNATDKKVLPINIYKYDEQDKRIALVYTGYIGNLKRCLTSLYHNLFNPDTDVVDVFLITKNMNINILEHTCSNTTIYTPVTPCDVTSINAAIRHMSNVYKTVNIIDVNKGGNCDSYRNYRSKFIDITKQYHNVHGFVENYDETNMTIEPTNIEKMYDMSYLTYLSVSEIERMERTKNIIYHKIVKINSGAVLTSKVDRRNMELSSLTVFKDDDLFCDKLTWTSSKNYKKIAREYYKKIGQYRKLNNSPPMNVDNTFTPNFQFTSFITELFDTSEIFVHRCNVTVGRVPTGKEVDVYGPTLVNVDNLFEYETRINCN